MTDDPNPYASPKFVNVPNSGSERLVSSRVGAAFFGAIIGLVVGLVWTLIFEGTNGWHMLRLHLLMYSTGYTATGLVVGLIQRLPIFVGALFGLAIMTTWTLNVGPNDGWMGLWLLFEAAPGFLLGGVIGIVFYHVTKRRTGKSLADEDQDAPPE